MKVLQCFTVVCNLTSFGGLVERATVDVCITHSVCGSGLRGPSCELEELQALGFANSPRNRCIQRAAESSFQRQVSDYCACSV